jgi:4-amino-4-deoxy-L-arabinose transferase-like glycosyltransferase
LAGELLVLSGFCAFLFFFGLGSFGLIGADEPRYAQIAREMLARHDWVTPVLNGVPWLEKPALYYWGAMLSYKAFGVSDWAARVPSAVLASAMVFAIYGFLRRNGGGARATDAALMTASCAAVIGFARGASTDMPLAATFTIGMLAWRRWQELTIQDCTFTIAPVARDSQSPIGNRQLAMSARRWLAVFYFFMALGTLAKGPVAAFLAALIVVGFAILNAPHGSESRATRFRRIVLGTLWWPGVLLYVAVALPWYVAVQRATGNFFRVFILENNLERFGTNLYRHQQPFWYFVPVLLISVLPWAVMVVAGAVNAVRGRWSMVDGNNADRRPLLAGGEFRVFLLLWCVLPVVFFSISQSKLPGYILPAVPAATLLGAEWLRERAASGARVPWWLWLLHSAVASVLLAAVLLAPHALVKTRPTAAALATTAVVAGVIFAAMALSLRSYGVPVARFITLAPVVLAVGFIVRVAAPVLDATQSARPVARKIAGLGYPSSSPVLLFRVKRETEFGLPFYRDAGVRNYQGGALPFTPAMVLTRQPEALMAALPPGTVLAHVASVPAQGIEIYMASPVPPRR